MNDLPRLRRQVIEGAYLLQRTLLPQSPLPPPSPSPPPMQVAQHPEVAQQSQLVRLPNIAQQLQLVQLPEISRRPQLVQLPEIAHRPQLAQHPDAHPGLGRYLQQMEEALWGEGAGPQRRRDPPRPPQQQLAAFWNPDVEVIEPYSASQDPIVIDDDENQFPISEDVASVRQPRSSEEDCVTEILQVLPDACPNFLKAMYREHHTLHEHLVPFLLDKFLEEGYTRAEKVEKNNKRKWEGKRKEILDYESPHRQDEGVQYITLIRNVLQHEFPFTPVKYIDHVINADKFLTNCYTSLTEAERKVESGVRPHPYHKMARRRKHFYDELKVGAVWDRVSAELLYLKEKTSRKKMKAQVLEDAKIAAEVDETEHRASGMMIECKCCYSEVSFSQATHCGEGSHFFCLDCARRNAENEIGMCRWQLFCMDSSGCRAEFSQSEISRFLDAGSITALERLQLDHSLRSAEIEGLVNCPFCDYAAICPPVEEDKEFRCENPECMEVTCRHCQRKSHLPLSCAEAMKDDKIAIRHVVEEAMTNALVRKCNNCSSPFIKEDGCNKMVCQKCHTMQCYICSKTIDSYKHFNDKARGGQAGNCPLFDNVEVRHETEIQEAAKVAREKILEEHPDLQGDDLDIRLSDEVKRQEEARLQSAAQRYQNHHGHRAQPAAYIRVQPRVRVQQVPAAAPAIPDPQAGIAPRLQAFDRPGRVRLGYELVHEHQMGFPGPPQAGEHGGVQPVAGRQAELDYYEHLLAPGVDIGNVPPLPALAVAQPAPAAAQPPVGGLRDLPLQQQLQRPWHAQHWRQGQLQQEQLQQEQLQQLQQLQQQNQQNQQQRHQRLQQLQQQHQRLWHLRNRHRG